MTLLQLSNPPPGDPPAASPSPPPVHPESPNGRQHSGVILAKKSRGDRKVNDYASHYTKVRGAFVCKQCNATIKTAPLFRAHFDREHLGIHHVCNRCSIEFCDKRTLDNHQKGCGKEKKNRRHGRRQPKPTSTTTTDSDENETIDLDGNTRPETPESEQGQGGDLEHCGEGSNVKEIGSGRQSGDGKNGEIRDNGDGERSSEIVDATTPPTSITTVSVFVLLFVIAEFSLMPIPCFLLSVSLFTEKKQNQTETSPTDQP